jgi:hypothetical protein
MQLVMDRVMPVRRGARVVLDLGPLDGTAASLATATTSVLNAVADATISAEEAQSLGVALAAAGAAYERQTLEARILALEQGHNSNDE